MNEVKRKGARSTIEKFAYRKSKNRLFKTYSEQNCPTHKGKILKG